MQIRKVYNLNKTMAVGIPKPIQLELGLDFNDYVVWEITELGKATIKKLDKEKLRTAQR